MSPFAWGIHRLVVNKGYVEPNFTQTNGILDPGHLSDPSQFPERAVLWFQGCQGTPSTTEPKKHADVHTVSSPQKGYIPLKNSGLETREAKG